MSQPDGCPPGGTESARAGAKSVLILLFISTIFHVALCATQTKLWSAYNLKVSFLCQVFLLQSLCTETPFSSWHLEKSFFRLLSAKPACVEEAQGLDRFIFFSLWSHAYRLPSQRSPQAQRTLQRLHFPFPLLFLGWGFFGEGKSVSCCSAYIPWVPLAQAGSALDCSFSVSFRGRVQPPLHGFMFALYSFMTKSDRLGQCWEMPPNTEISITARGFQWVLLFRFSYVTFLWKAELEWCFVPKLLALLVGIQYFDNLLRLNSTALFLF